VFYIEDLAFFNNIGQLSDITKSNELEVVQLKYRFYSSATVTLNIGHQLSVASCRLVTAERTNVLL